MGIWKLLGIEPTEDVKTIKRAYAQKLRIYHPEDDPQGFQQLREAYDAALTYSKWLMEDAIIVDQPDDFLSFDSANTLETVVGIANTKKWTYGTPEIEKLDDAFIERIKVLYNDFSQRIDIKNWEQLFNYDAMWDFSHRAQLSYRVLEFLTDHRNIPQNVWIFLTQNFNWNDQQELYGELHEDIIKYIKMQVKRVWGLSYDYINVIEGVDYDTYLDCREKALLALEEGHMYSAMACVNQAEDMIKDDPELLYLRGRSLLLARDMNGALAVFDSVMSIIPNHVGCLLYRGTIQYE